MAGSYRHIADDNNEFRGTDLLDNLGDAYEALEECYLMIAWLTKGDKDKIFEAWREGYLRNVNPEECDRSTASDYWDDS